MKDKIDSTIKTIFELKSGVSLFSKELDKIQSQLNELREIINSQSQDSLQEERSTPSTVVNDVPKKKPSLVVRREDQEDVEVLDSSGYTIQVVGLGVQKLE